MSLDEGIIPWRRLFFRIYNAGKIIKHGILIHMVCKSKTRYIYNFEIYCTQEMKLLKTVQVIISLYIDLWHYAYVDNYYSSDKQLQNKIRICSTI